MQLASLAFYLEFFVEKVVMHMTVKLDPFSLHKACLNVYTLFIAVICKTLRVFR